MIKNHFASIGIFVTAITVIVVGGVLIFGFGTVAFIVALGAGVVRKLFKRLY